jgi:predicted AAA+ superfamily ATPase
MSGNNGLSQADLVENNPWWLDKKAIDEDPRIVEWEASKFKWTPRLGETFDWELDVIYVLRGPRQVGKTTLMKLKIRDLLEDGVEARHIFYWPCDLVEGPERLVQIITSYQDFSRKDTLAKGGVGLKGWLAGPKPKTGVSPGAQDKTIRLYIVLDEISSVRDWQKGIKSLYDAGRLRKCTLVLTGSHSIDLRKATETLARRRGEVERLTDHLPDKILLPTKFAEYVETRSEKIRNMIRDLDLLMRPGRHALWGQIMKGDMPKELEDLQLVSKEVQTLFNEYLLTGGVPKVVDSYMSSGSIPKNLYEDYVSLVLRDVARWNGKEIVLRQVVRKLMESLGTAVSLNGLRQETDVSSHHTTGVYLDFLKDSFVTTVISKLDVNKDASNVRDPRKSHFEDPFIFHALRSWALGRDPYREALNFVSEPEKVSKLVESVVASHLVRLLFSYNPSTLFDYSSQLFYWEGSSSRQLDFAVRLGSKYLPVEVKYQNRISSDDAKPLVDFQKAGKSTNGLILTKDKLATKGSHLEIPVHLALLLI